MSNGQDKTEKAREAAAKARITKLKIEADALSISYQDDVTEETLKMAIAEYKTAYKGAEEKASEPTSIATQEVAKEIGKSIGQEVGAALRKARGDEDGDRNRRRITDAELDASEFGELKTYFAYGTFYKISSKTVGGLDVEAPFGPMKFEFMDGESVTNGNQSQTRYLCSYPTKLKREQVFIESMPQFGKRIFISASEALNPTESGLNYSAYAKHIANLSTYQARELYDMAARLELKLSTSTSVPALREAIATELTERDIVERRNRYATDATAMTREEQLKRVVAQTA
jgi:CRISPR/Cas system CSM-associated protein Csm2 small subunit